MCFYILYPLVIIMLDILPFMITFLTSDNGGLEIENNGGSWTFIAVLHSIISLIILLLLIYLIYKIVYLYDRHFIRIELLFVAAVSATLFLVARILSYTPNFFFQAFFFVLGFGF